MLTTDSLAPTAFEGPEATLFLLEPPLLRILPFREGAEVVLPAGDLVAFLIHLAAFQETAAVMRRDVLTRFFASLSVEI